MRQKAIGRCATHHTPAGRGLPFPSRTSSCPGRFCGKRARHAESRAAQETSTSGGQFAAILHAYAQVVDTGLAKVEPALGLRDTCSW